MNPEINSKHSSIAAQLDFVHRWLPKDSKLTLLALHGTGGNEADLIPLAEMLAPTASILSPRGKVLENGMPRFFRRLREGVFDEADIRQRATELADFIRAAQQHYDFGGRLFAVGYSNGANIASSVMFLQPDVLQGALLFRPMVPLELEVLPDLTNLPVFLSAGEQDPIVPTENVERLAEMFRQAGAEVTLHWEEGGHGLGQAELQQARDWLAAR